jgi:hypothetical protein
VIVLTHKNRDRYERFMTEVWYPRALKFGTVDSGFGAALARRWRLVGTEPGEADSLYAYMFLHPAFQTTSASEMWRQIGLSDEEIARDSATHAGSDRRLRRVHGRAS